MLSPFYVLHSHGPSCTQASELRCERTNESHYAQCARTSMAFHSAYTHTRLTKCTLCVRRPCEKSNNNGTAAGTTTMRQRKHRHIAWRYGHYRRRKYPCCSVWITSFFHVKCVSRCLTVCLCIKYFFFSFEIKEKVRAPVSAPAELRMPFTRTRYEIFNFINNNSLYVYSVCFFRSLRYSLFFFAYSMEFFLFVSRPLVPGCVFRFTFSHLHYDYIQGARYVIYNAL